MTPGVGRRWRGDLLRLAAILASLAALWIVLDTWL